MICRVQTSLKEKGGKNGQDNRTGIYSDNAYKRCMLHLTCSYQG